MSIRFNLVLSDDLNREIDRAVEETENSKSEIIRKALQLYLAAHDGRRKGFKVGLVEADTEKLKTEFIGL